MKNNFFKCICINKSPQIRELDYSSCFLREVPQELFNHERTIECVNLDNNNISELTKELFCCKALKELILSDNELCYLPDTIDELSHLSILNVSKNNLPQLPEKIGNCAQLVSLNVSGNVLEKLPDAVCRLTMLQELLVNSTLLTVLPHNIGRLVNLRHLEVRENEIKVLPNNIGNLSSLQYLDVGNNELSDLPDSMCRLSKLTVLTADKNNLASLPEKIGSCAGLQVLEVQQNCLTSLPDSICQCVLLTELVVSHNQLESLPAFTGHLIRLKNLRLDHNLISVLPDTIGQLDSLAQLYVSSNQLTRLPQSIGLLRRLRDFHADSNEIADIPAEIGSCSSLTVLSLRGNKIQYLPDEIGRVARLKMLNLSNNRLKFLPLSFLKLRELRAVWLNDNQTQPLVQLQSERDVDTGRKCLVCYLLPQMTNTEDPEAADNDPGDWQRVQESRPRVVQWRDETPLENTAQLKSRLPKDAPAKQANAKQTVAKQIKPAVYQASQPVILGNGDCVMMNTSTMQHNLDTIGNEGWGGNVLCYPSTRSQTFQTANGGVSRQSLRRMGGGYESDTAVMRSTRSWGRSSNQMAPAYEDRRLAQVHEYIGTGHPVTGDMGVVHLMHGAPATGTMMQGAPATGAMMPGRAAGYWRHPAAGGMVGGRQSGYSTDTGPVLHCASNGHRQARHRPAQAKQTHHKNPFDQLRVIRSGDPPNYEANAIIPRAVPLFHCQTSVPTNSSSLPPPPTRQPPVPPQRPLPCPPFLQANMASLVANCTLSDNRQMPMVSSTLPLFYSQPVHPSLAPTQHACTTDPRSTCMVIPCAPYRAPPHLATTFPSEAAYLQQAPPSSASSNLSATCTDDQHSRASSTLNRHTYFSSASVVIVRDSGLGFSITGGISSNPNSFRPEDKGIFVAKVNPAGPADGRLRVGDKICMVNGVSFIGLQHSAAVNVLKSCGELVQMIIERLFDRDTDI